MPLMQQHYYTRGGGKSHDFQCHFASQRGVKKGFLSLCSVLPGSQIFSVAHRRVSGGHKGKPKWWRANEATVRGREEEGCIQVEKTVEQSLLTYLEAHALPLFLVLAVNKLTPGPIPSALKACALPSPTSHIQSLLWSPDLHPKNEAGYAQLSFIFSF